jgi:hypothetical protein
MAHELQDRTGLADYARALTVASCARGEQSHTSQPGGRLIPYFPAGSFTMNSVLPGSEVKVMVPPN